MRFKKMIWSVVDYESFKQGIIALKDWEYEIISVEEKRSEKANRYLWGWVYTPIAEWTWYDKDKVHAIMSFKFLRDHTGKSEYVKSTSMLSPKEFAEYVDNIRNFVAPFWVYIPSSEEYLNSNSN